jgi:sugar (pentulose or hexulose) kinase
LNAIDESQADKLPRLISSDQPAGRLSPATAKELGLQPGVLVSTGGGDNMMGAIGTGNTRHGIVTASFGTSGTIYACMSKPVVDPQGEIAAFCDSTNRWLPLLCTMNMTVATEMVRKDFGLDHAAFEQTAAQAPGGCDGLFLLPYLEGERTSNVPDGTRVYCGVNTRTFTAHHFACATMEGVTLGMNYGLRRLAQLPMRRIIRSLICSCLQIIASRVLGRADSAQEAWREGKTNPRDGWGCKLEALAPDYGRHLQR